MRIPKPLRPLYDAWMAFSQALGKVMGAILLTIIWIVVFGIYAVVIKIIRLFQKTDPRASTWTPCTPEDASTMRRSF